MYPSFLLTIEAFTIIDIININNIDNVFKQVNAGSTIASVTKLKVMQFVDLILRKSMSN
jgi:hypothetical protein